MKYCPKCKKIYTQEQNLCAECKNSVLASVKDKQTPLLLCNCNASQREMLMSALKENGIASGYENQSQHSGMAMEGFDVLVPAGMYKSAYNIAVEMGMIEYDEDFYESFEQLQLMANDEAETFEEMSPAKRTTVRILSAFALIVLFALVILGVDYVLALIKNLFM